MGILVEGRCSQQGEDWVFMAHSARRTRLFVPLLHPGGLFEIVQPGRRTDAIRNLLPTRTSHRHHARAAIPCGSMRQSRTS